eukprot:268339_1
MRRDRKWIAYLLPPFIAAKFITDSALFISNLTEDRAIITDEVLAEADTAAMRPEYPLRIVRNNWKKNTAAVIADCAYLTLFFSADRVLLIAKTLALDDCSEPLVEKDLTTFSTRGMSMMAALSSCTLL